MLASPKVKQAFDLSLEPDRLRDDYGRTTYGQSCLLARRLVEAGVRFVIGLLLRLRSAAMVAAAGIRTATTSTSSRTGSCRSPTRPCRP